MVFNTGPYTVLPDNSILITANIQSETGFPSSHQLKSYVASKSRLKLAARAVLSADAGFLFLLTSYVIIPVLRLGKRRPVRQSYNVQFIKRIKLPVGPIPRVSKTKRLIFDHNLGSFKNSFTDSLRRKLTVYSLYLFLLTFVTTLLCSL